MSPLSPRTPSSSEEDNVFGSSENVYSTKSSNSVNSRDRIAFQDDQDGYADLVGEKDDTPLIDSDESRTPFSSRTSLVGKKSVNILNGSIVSLSSQLSKQFQAIEDEEDNKEEKTSLVGHVACDDDLEGLFGKSVDSNERILTGPSFPSKPSDLLPSPESANVMETSVDSGEIDPEIKPSLPRKPSQQTTV